MNLHNVIVTPVITEKTEEQKIQRAERYVFKIHPKANKELVRQALYKIYKVDAVKINTMVVPGKKRRFRSTFIKLPSWKKAIVTLSPGQSIELMKAE